MGGVGRRAGEREGREEARPNVISKSQRIGLCELQTLSETDNEVQKTSISV